MRAHPERKHKMGRRFAIVIGVAAAGVMALGAQTAAADSVDRTEGDARAAFEAVAGAGFTVGESPGAPAGGIPTGTDGDVHSPEDVRIYPNGKGFSYCASGWHVIFLGWWDELQFHDSYEDLHAYLSAVDIQFAWDGVPLVEERTAIKRANFPFLEDAFFFAAGTFMPPGTLSVGKHRLTTTVIDPIYRDGTWSVNANILPC